MAWPSCLGLNSGDRHAQRGDPDPLQSDQKKVDLCAPGNGFKITKSWNTYHSNSDQYASFAAPSKKNRISPSIRQHRTDFELV